MPSSKELAKTLQELMKQEHADQLVDEFFMYLEEKNLLGFLDQIKLEVMRLEKEEAEFNTLVIESKHHLSDDEIRKIKTLVGAREDTLHRLIVSPETIGSVRALYQGKRYDGSLETAFNAMKTQLTS